VAHQFLSAATAAAAAAAAAVFSCCCQWGSYAAPYGAEKAKMNALMSIIDSELQLAGVTGVSVQVGSSSIVVCFIGAAALHEVVPRRQSGSRSRECGHSRELPTPFSACHCASF
jgi:hypothetical protein